MRAKRTVELRYSVAMPIMVGIADDTNKPSMDLLEEKAVQETA